MSFTPARGRRPVADSRWWAGSLAPSLQDTMAAPDLRASAVCGQSNRSRSGSVKSGREDRREGAADVAEELGDVDRGQGDGEQRRAAGQVVESWVTSTSERHGRGRRHAGGQARRGRPRSGAAEVGTPVGSEVGRPSGRPWADRRSGHHRGRPSGWAWSRCPEAGRCRRPRAARESAARCRAGSRPAARRCRSRCRPWAGSERCRRGRCRAGRARAVAPRRRCA